MVKGSRLACCNRFLTAVRSNEALGNTCQPCEQVSVKNCGHYSQTGAKERKRWIRVFAVNAPSVLEKRKTNHLSSKERWRRLGSGSRLQFVHVVVQRWDSLFQALAFTGLSDDHARLAIGYHGVTRQNLPMVEHTLREGLSASVGSQVSSEACMRKKNEACYSKNAKASLFPFHCLKYRGQTKITVTNAVSWFESKW